MKSDLLIYACALSRIFASKCAVSRQLAEYGDIGDFFDMSREQLLEILPTGSNYVDSILDPQILEWANKEIEWTRKYGIDVIYIKDERYPKRLKECPDAPLVLYYKGNADLNAEKILSVVGTRQASIYGKDCCRKIIERLSRQVIKPLIVSGLAYGIDATAHRSAIEFGLPTVGVMATGLNEIYPHAHKELAKEIVEKGGLLTDFPSGTTPFKGNFVRRNRIIAGIADATLLVESFSKGGGIITASLANSYSRELFAVPGRITDLSFEGCNRLIGANMASIVKDVSTIGKILKWDSKDEIISNNTIFGELDNEVKIKIMEVLKLHTFVSVENLLSLTSLSLEEVSLNLLEMEMDGLIRSVQGNKYTT